jgi:penicillin-binding protein 1A
LIDRREQVLDPMTAYQITSMMEGVVVRGTAAGAGFKEIGKPIAGKTGTTNDAKDVWFIGFSPDLAVGVYLGYDKPRSIGSRATGGGLAAPIVKEFMKAALANKPPVPFRVPSGIKLVRVDPRSGTRVGPGAAAILEGFKPGTAPPDGYAYADYDGAYDSRSGGRSWSVTPDDDRAIRRGPGGLY